MSKTRIEKAALKAARKIKALPKPTHEQISQIYKEFQRYAHIP